MKRTFLKETALNRLTAVSRGIGRTEVVQTPSKRLVERDGGGNEDHGTDHRGKERSGDQKSEEDDGLEAGEAENEQPCHQGERGEHYGPAGEAEGG